jgi:hypothetical protein
VAGRADRRRRDAPHEPPRRRVLPRDLRGPEGARVLRGLRGAHRRLHDARRGWHAGPAHVRRRREGRRLRPRRDAALRDAPVQHPPRDAARPPRPEDGPAHAPPPGRGGGRLLRRRRAHALFHSLAVPGQPHEALPRRDGADALEVRDRRRRGRPAHGRLSGHEQVADVLEGPRVLSERSGRHDERLVDGRGRPRPAPAHPARGLGRRPGVARGRAHRLPPRRGPPPARPRERRRRRPRHPAFLGLRPGARVVGEEAARLPERDGAVAEGRSRRAHRAWPGLRGACEAGAPGGGHAQAGRPLSTRDLLARRQEPRGAVRRIGRGGALDAARERRGPGRGADEGRHHPALAGGAVAGRQVDRPHGQGAPALDLEQGQEDRPARRDVARRRRRGPRVVSRRPLAGVRHERRQLLRPDLRLQPGGRDDDRGDHRPLRQLQPHVEPRRSVALLPLRSGPAQRRAIAVGAAPAGPLHRRSHRDLRPVAEEGRALPVRPRRRAARRGGLAGGREEGEGEAPARARVGRDQISTGSRSASTGCRFRPGA